MTLATSSNLAGAQLLGMNQAVTTLHLADPQFEYLGPRAFTKNEIVDYFLNSANRNVTCALTDALYLDSLLTTVRSGLPAGPTSIQVLGDIPDTPCRSEVHDFENVLDRHDLPVNGYDRGNHSSANLFGVVNLLSRAYRFLKGLLGRGADLDKELTKACGGKDNVLTPQGTFDGMHRVLHRETANPPGVEAINTPVRKADQTSPSISFWKQTRPDYWETLVNYQIADQPVERRKSDVHPFYLQASLQARFRLDDGNTLPVYTISLDSQDTTNAFAGQPEISEFQVRLVEAFIEEKRRENPRALFKLSMHFPTDRVLGCHATRTNRAALRRLLEREEVIFCTSGHTHERNVRNLTDVLGLDRKTPLTEVIVPSLIDYSPVDPDSPMGGIGVENRDFPPDSYSGSGSAGTRYKDARAMGIERMWVEKGADGRTVLKIETEYKGLDREDFGDALTTEVQQALAWHQQEHGYMRTDETFRELKAKYLKGFLKRQGRRLWQLLTVGLNPFRWKAFRDYWRTASPLQNLFDNLKTVSVIQMFNEAEHLVPFLDGILHFMNSEEPGQLAVKAQIEGIRTLLASEYQTRLPQFDAAFSRGDEAAQLVRYNDLFQRVGLSKLPKILLDLKPGSEARVFAVQAGIEATREEFEFHRGKPTRIPNKVPSVTIPVG